MATLEPRLVMLFAALVLLVPPRSHGASGCDDLTGLPINRGARWPAVWQALNDLSSCTQNCHNGMAPTGDLDFSSSMLSIYFLVNQPSNFDTRLLRVDPGDPRGSLLFQKVSCSTPDAGGPMPPPSGHLPANLQGLIYDWIEQGAFGEGIEDPIARDYIFRDSMESLRR